MTQVSPRNLPSPHGNAPMPAPVHGLLQANFTRGHGNYKLKCVTEHVSKYASATFPVFCSITLVYPVAQSAKSHGDDTEGRGR